MKKFYLIFVLILSSVATVEAQKREMFGAYQDCPFPCFTIQIRPDHTFVYRSDGDLFNDERYFGTWVYLGADKFHAVIPENHTPPQVKESSVEGRTDFQLQISDRNGQLITGVTIAAIGTAENKKAVTGDRGMASIARCDEFEISFASYRGKHRPRRKDANTFEIILTVEQTSALALDDVWLVERNKLYIAGEDGKFDKRRAFKKLSRAQEEKIFQYVAAQQAAGRTTTPQIDDD
jgi:hypothetical protein